MTTESLTYSELGDRLGNSPEAARSLARRLRLLRKPSNDGKVRVILDLAEIQYKPVVTRSSDGPQGDIPALNSRIEQLQAELAKLKTEKNCLEAGVAAHRVDFERERNRCDKLIAETLVLNKVAMPARENAARLEGELSGRRGRRVVGTARHSRSRERATASRNVRDRKWACTAPSDQCGCRYLSSKTHTLLGKSVMRVSHVNDSQHRGFTAEAVLIAP